MAAKKPSKAVRSAIVCRSAGELSVPASYGELLADLKARIRIAQVKAALAVNRELILLYWEIGRAIIERQDKEGWGRKIIDRLADDLQAEFPGESGFSRANIYQMRQFFVAYREQSAIVQQAVGQLPGPPPPLANIPWGHNTILLQKLKDPAERLWYAEQTITHGWSRAVLVHQIETGLYQRQGKALTNFERTLPAAQSDLAQQALKDPYCVGFLALAADARERELERGLLAHLRDFLLELGVGFAFVGSQVPLEVGGQDYYLDLLFYHLRLRCFVVIDLKTEAFQPEFTGKMSFYLSAVDDQFRHPADQPSIGLILCKEKNRVIVEYALRDASKPMGVASYEPRRGELPAAFRDNLPSVERLAAELREADPVG